MPGRWAAVVLVAAVGVGPAAGQDLSAEQIRDKVRQAVGYDAFQKLKDGIVLEGKSEYRGSPGTFRTRLHPDGRYVRTWTAEGEHGQGFDGKTRWDREFSRPPSVEGLYQADRSRLVFAVHGHRWLAPDGGYAVALDPKVHRPYRPCLIVSHPDGKAVARVLIEPDTGLPRTAEVWFGRAVTLLALDDYREVAGAKVAGRVSWGTGGEKIEYAADRAGPAGPAAEAFAPPAVPPDTEYDPAVPAGLAVKRAGDRELPADPLGGHQVIAKSRADHVLLVRPTFDGKPGPWFVLATDYGRTCITDAAAEKLGLPLVARYGSAGPESRREGGMRRAGRFTLGPATVRGLVLQEFPADVADLWSRLWGVEVGGVLGGDFYNRAVVELDSRAGTVAVHDPATYRLPPGGGWSPVRFGRASPCVEGTLEGRHTGLFEFSTYVGSQVLFEAPAVTRLGLLDGRTVEMALRQGREGMVRVRKGSGAEFRALGRTVKDIQAVFELDGEGDPYTLGSFGPAALGPGTVVFDYPNRRVAFVPKP